MHKLPGRQRVVIEAVKPEIDCGRFPIKRVHNERVTVQAAVFADGHDEIAAQLLYRNEGGHTWHSLPMQRDRGDSFSASFQVEGPSSYSYTVQGWVDRFATWRKDFAKKRQAGQPTEKELEIGRKLVESALPYAGQERADRLKERLESIEGAATGEERAALLMDESLATLVRPCVAPERITTYERTLRVLVERKRAAAGAWYEFFPRSAPAEGREHATLTDAARLLPEIARMGFDVVYLPPIHPIGHTNRKGKNNSVTAEPGDPGSPWAIGSGEGGHTSVHPRLGTEEDYLAFTEQVREQGMEPAMDLAFQCAPDHPLIAEHPEWFKWRPDGTIQHAENPPKRYEDIVPFDFECDAWQSLWEAARDIVLYWAERGIRIFRVDNPHTKPFVFWEWLLQETRRAYPDLIFLSEAFTRPSVMKRLAKLGFSQSYTYFTWRNTKEELEAYVTELTATETAEYLRPNFWPNTPDILPEYLQYGGRAAFVIRLVLAATLSSCYGILGPAYELMEDRALPGREEYLDSEKYQIRQWDRERPDRLNDLIARINDIRRHHAPLRQTRNITFLESANEHILAYMKTIEASDELIVVTVNLDPFHHQEGGIRMPLEQLGMGFDQPYLLHDLLGEERYFWQGDWNSIGLDPQVLPARIFLVRKRMRKEEDFDYFM
ncbi:MAG: alpha-1,4-glucan--maltose-1-phosphate maltosyltransferase [Synergistales bacterium]|nr:alpha-1,4-glucan--maltose-1-phosphate maltosyltransferase [Synergistales bacterium]